MLQLISKMGSFESYQKPKIDLSLTSDQETMSSRQIVCCCCSNFPSAALLHFCSDDYSTGQSWAHLCPSQSRVSLFSSQQSDCTTPPILCVLSPSFDVLLFLDCGVSELHVSLLAWPTFQLLWCAVSGSPSHEALYCGSVPCDPNQAWRCPTPWWWRRPSRLCWTRKEC